MPQSWSLLVLALTIITFLTQSSPMSQILMSNVREHGSYEAPIMGCDEAEDIVKDSYQVFLHKGYSLDQHKENVSGAVDLDSAIRHILNETERHGLYYDATLDGDALAAVRADIGVDLVVCDVRGHPD